MKKMILPMLALVAGIAFSAFTHQRDNSTNLTDNWFEYQGPLPGSDADLTLETNYVKVSAPTGCDDVVNMCAIKAPGTGDHPDTFTAQIESDIKAARDNQQPVPNYILLKE